MKVKFKKSFLLISLVMPMLLLFSTYSYADTIPEIVQPTITGMLQSAEDLTVKTTGTDILAGAYRIFYTTEATPLSIAEENEPGAGWVDSLISGATVVESSTNMKVVIPKATFDGKDWTYITVKMAAQSDTGNWSAPKYTLACRVKNAYPTSPIGYIGHNQLINVFNNGQNVVVSGPSTTVAEYNSGLESYDDSTITRYTTFINHDNLKYRYEFDVNNSSFIKNIVLMLDTNYYNQEGLNFEVNGMQLKKMQANNTFTTIKTYSNGEYTQIGNGIYTLEIGDSTISENGVGRYAVEYTGTIHIEKNIASDVNSFRNNVEMEVYLNDAYGSSILEPEKANKKFHIDTKIFNRDIKVSHLILNNRKNKI